MREERLKTANLKLLKEMLEFCDNNELEEGRMLVELFINKLK